MAQQKQQQVDVAIKTRWDIDAIPAVQPVNQLLVQNTPAGEIILLLGYLDAPITWGNPEQQLAQARELSKKGLEIQPVARIVMTPQTSRQLQVALATQNDLAVHQQIKSLKTAPSVQ